LFAVFVVGEYFRSWQFYQHVFSGTFLEFAIIRFAGYYATALNTGAALCTLNDPLYPNADRGVVLQIPALAADATRRIGSPLST